MHTETIYIILSVIIISLISVVAIIPLLITRKIPQRVLLALLSLSAGTLLGSVFIHFIPETFREGYHLGSALFVLSGFLTFFVLERFIHWHHNHKNIQNVDEGAHSHAYHLAPINLIGDGIHNLLDGLVIAGAYLANIPLGIAATISVALHELPQEIADFGVLLYSGMKRRRALILNFISALTALLGAIAGIILNDASSQFTHFIIPFTAGNFIYIAASNLVPELHRHFKLIDTVIHLIAIITGIAVMALLLIIAPEHTNQ